MAEQSAKKSDEGLPAWVMTFADLMTLLMCFFVLLLSFSDMELNKFKQVAGSMKFAFGVQREVKTIEPPKGTSIIAQEFSPGKPTPTPLKILRQNTRDETKQTIDFTDAKVREIEARRKVKEFKTQLQKEVKAKLVDMEQQQGSVVIRIRERGSFPLGSALMNPSFIPVLQKVATILAKTEGIIKVGGHTDNLPIATELYRSNWDLSSARAVSVVHVLLGNSDIEPARILAEGHADARPLVENDSFANRARNRRVEIVIEQDPRKMQQLRKLQELSRTTGNETLKPPVTGGNRSGGGK